MMKEIGVAVFACALSALGAAETLKPLADGAVPQNLNELWRGYDPRAEPLEIEVFREWEEDGIILKVLRYRVGVFKGQKAMMAAVYGCPKGGKNLPGLVQIHGGGQYAHVNACRTNAKRGYATLSIAWAGRIDAPDYRVSPNEVKLFWENKTDDPNYRVTTDWGALDAYHAPCRYPGNTFVLNPPGDHSLDSVESPRNSGWFLCTIAARRALTFLEQQPEVDADRLGVYGHSMGGKLTVLTAGSDRRVKAAAPSCGGISDRDNESALFRNTLGDDPYLKQITCPIIFLAPANDFHGRIDDLPTSIEDIQTDEWRVTCSPHHNHQDTAEYEVATQLWMDQHLKGTFEWPQTPETALKLNTKNGIPLFAVQPDAAKKVLSVEVYYTQQGQIDGLKDDYEHAKNRFWHYANPINKGGVWTAALPVYSTELPLWVYANVKYALPKPVSGAGYYYRIYTTEEYNLSSPVQMMMPEQLQQAGVKSTLMPSSVVEPFDDSWRREWFTYRPEQWGLTTHKIYHPMWAAPEGAKLALEVRAEKANTLVIAIDTHAAEVALAGGSQWQAVALAPEDFKDAGQNGLDSWEGIAELRLAAGETLRKHGSETTRKVGGEWKGTAPEFRNLRWITE